MQNLLDLCGVLIQSRSTLKVNSYPCSFRKNQCWGWANTPNSVAPTMEPDISNAQILQPPNSLVDILTIVKARLEEYVFQVLVIIIGTNRIFTQKPAVN